MKSIISPAAIEAESRIIAICAENLEKVDLVTAEPGDFALPKWRLCFEALRDLRASFEGSSDPLVLLDRVCELVDGITLGDLVNIEANPGMIESYSQIVREEAASRRLRLGLSQVLTSMENGATVNEGLSQASLAIMSATMGQPDQAKTVGDILSGRYHELAELAEKKARGELCVTGITTGIAKLDEVLGGIQRGIPTLLAARPGMGKSALALNITNAANLAGIGVHVFSLEDTESAYADRVLSLASGVNSLAIRSLDLTRGQIADLEAAGNKARKRDGWIVDDRSAITADEIVRCVRRKALENRTGLVVVDYVQLLRGSRGQSTREILGDAINAFGDAAKADGMAYLVLSQLNRDCEKRDDKRPGLHDLKECGTLEERAKACIMLYRPAVYGDRYTQGQYRGNEQPGQHKGSLIPESVIEMLVRKNSQGQTGTVLGVWQPERMRIK